jgi:aromatic ring-opening dioxygenase catalytic subunit (LigB family)
MWTTHGLLDPEILGDRFKELVRQAPAGVERELRPEVLAEKAAQCESAIAEMRDRLAAARPDVLLVVGDDQEELFIEYKPAFAIFAGEEATDLPVDTKGWPPSLRAASWAIHAEEQESYAVHSLLARHLIDRLGAAGFDLTVCNRQVPGRSLGHAFTWPRLRLRPGMPMLPVVPVFINCYYPPNQPSAARCVALGQALRAAITEWPSDERVAIAASGGLSHFLVEESLDRLVLTALANKDLDALSGIDGSRLQSGSSEILNWMCLAGAVASTELRMELLSYIAAYRTKAATGVGLAFAVWS